MIVFMNVCDHCGTQNQILSGSSNGIDIAFDISEPYETTQSPTRYRTMGFSGTFCDKECFILYLKENLDTKGFLRIKNEY